MKSEFDALTEEYESSVKKLQRTCLHKRKSAWMEQWWALGHSTGYVVRACRNCNKILERKKGYGEVTRWNTRTNSRGARRLRMQRVDAGM